MLGFISIILLGAPSILMAWPSWPLSLFAAACCRSGSTKATDVAPALCAAGAAERPTSADSGSTLKHAGESGDQVPCTSAHGKNTSGGSQNQKTMGDVGGVGSRRIS